MWSAASLQVSWLPPAWVPGWVGGREVQLGLRDGGGHVEGRGERAWQFWQWQLCLWRI